MTETEFNNRMAAIDKPASVFNWRARGSSIASQIKPGNARIYKPDHVHGCVMSANINTEAKDGKFKQKVRALV